ncbi:MAG: Ltp family lipoprotein [Microthrixaceae bacterium]|nr:Ltp family lipoprotein [Microthrixaceae bacterium]
MHNNASLTETASSVKTKAPWYKRKGIVIPLAVIGGIIVVSGVASAAGGGGDRDREVVADQPAVSQLVEEEAAVVTVEVPDLVGMTGADAQEALAALGLKADAGGDDLAMPVIAQGTGAGTQAAEGSTVRLTLQEKPKLTLAQENAVRSASQYLDVMPFSRAGLINQLTSEYGSGFAPEDAEFAVATLEQAGKVDWNAEAAEAAKSYLDVMAFSRDGLFEQLTSSYGAGFTPEQAEAGLAAVGY